MGKTRANRAKQNPKLMQREMADGRICLYLEYYIGRRETPVLDEYGEQMYYESGAMAGKPIMKVTHNRKKENLHLYIEAKPRTPIERSQNKETLALAEKIRYEREQQFLEDREGYRLKREEKVNFLDYCQNYIDRYTKGDIRMIRLAYNRFLDFLKDTPEYNVYSRDLKPNEITKDMMVDFTEYLQSRGHGEGPKTIYQRFKKIVNRAVEDGMMLKNPCKDVRITTDDNILRKEILSLDEIALLIRTKDEKQNMKIRNAFLFSCFTGIRFCDIVELTYNNIDYSNKILKFEQKKVKGHSGSSGVVIPLEDTLMHLLGTPEDGDLSKKIFPLPSYTMCLKSIDRWVKRAGINKHITWHCARHSFAVNILNNGANIKTVASLLGHSGLKHTEKYTRAVDKLKEDAVKSLIIPELKNL